MSFCKEIENHVREQLSRRNFLSRTGLGLGAAAMASLLGSDKSMAGKVLAREEEKTGIPLGLPHFAPKAKKQGAIAIANIKILDADKTTPDFKFTVNEKFLALPVPDASNLAGDNAPVLRITGLKKGFYTLTANGAKVITASAKDWKKGVEIKQRPSYIQVAEIRDMILQKNELHFFQYRPINETYIIGFRSYEQGKYVKELADQNIYA